MNEISNEIFSDEAKDQLKQTANQSISDAEEMESYDHTTSSIILTATVANLTEHFFVVRGLPVPEPKDSLAKIKDIDDNFYLLLVKFHKDNKDIYEKFRLANKMVPAVFN